MNPALSIVEDAMMAIVGMLLNDDETLTGAMAETNACGYGLEEHDIHLATFESPDRIRFACTFSVEGETGEDHAWCGDRIDAEAQGTMVLVNGKWEADEVSVISASSNLHDDIDDEADALDW